MDPPNEGQQMVFTHRVQFNILHEHHFLIIFLEHGGLQHLLWIGAIALGHPVGSSATRLIITLLKEMKRRDVNLGLATLCVGGGQGAAFVLER